MTLVINLSDTLADKVKAEAQKRHRSPEEIIVDILSTVFEENRTSSVSEIVALIKATTPDPAMVIPAEGSLAEALRDGPTDPNFDLQTWEREWRAVEAELKQINRFNAMEDGAL